MFKNYFIIALRNLRKQKGYSVINIFGLAIGIATCLMIAMYVTDELSYDRYTANASRIYRINTDIRFGGSTLHMTQTSDMMGQLLQKDYPQVEATARMYTSNGSQLIRKGNEFINEPRVAHVDSSFFNVFDLPSLEGNTKTALNEPNTVVINESTAKKYFHTVKALGKIVEVKNGQTTTPYKVTAVIEDIPRQSHFNLDFMFSMKNADYQWGRLTSHNFHTYLLLKPGTDPIAFQKNFDVYIDKYVLPSVRQFMNIGSMDEFKKSGNNLAYTLMPITKIHLYSDYSFELNPTGNIQYIYIFSAVALFILILACINFMNLSTARSTSRAKEVGIRKVLGTERNALITQFLAESILTAFISLLIGLCVAWLLLPLFNDIAAKSLSMADLLSVKILPFIILMPVIVGVLAGGYPAFYLSGFKPIAVLKGHSNTGFRKSNLRSTLVVFQFAVSIMLIIGTIIVYSQLHYIQTARLGFDKDQVLVVNDTYALDQNVQAFKNEVLGLPGVRSATVSSFLPVSSSSRSDNTYSKTPVPDPKSGLDMQTWVVDYDYIQTMGMEIVQGRNFSRNFGNDSNAIILTETTARMFDLKDPVGKMIYAPSNLPGDNSYKPIEVIGIVKDFHFESLRQQIGPLSMRLGNSTGLTSFKVSAGQSADLIKKIGQKWKLLAPGMPFRYFFLNDSFNDMYRSEQRTGTIAIIFAVLAVVIACMGLFGLVTYMAEQRRKEIGIRKVLGASVNNMVLMLSKDFLRLVFIALIVAFPIAWWAMKTWLSDFEYRVQMTWWVFVFAGGIAILIAFLTVSTQAIKAALANPVTSLRSE